MAWIWMVKPSAQSSIKRSPMLIEKSSVIDMKYTPAMARRAPAMCVMRSVSLRKIPMIGTMRM